MDPIDTQELIEQYLNGTLSDEQKDAVDARLETDHAFRAELELHRQLQEEFADPKKLQLRDALHDLMQNPPPISPVKSWLKRASVLVMVLFVAVLSWRNCNQTPTSQNVPNLPNEPDAPLPIQNGTDSTPPGINKELQQRKPMAMATDPRFLPSPRFNSRNNIRSSSNLKANFLRPGPDTDFPIINGKVKLEFRGSATATADTSTFPLVLYIYDNQPDSDPLLELKLQVEFSSENPNLWLFNVEKLISLQRGLYYFTLEAIETADLFYIGKFTVGARE